MINDFPEQTGQQPAATRTCEEPLVDRGSGNGTTAAPIPPIGAAVTQQTYVPVAAAEAMLAVRHKQIFQFGHTLEADLLLSLEDFAKHLRRQSSAVIEDLQFRVDPVITQRHLAKLGALAMAVFDRLEAEKDRA